MAKLEQTIKSEIIRLSKREVRKISVPLSKEVRQLKSTVSQIRKAVLALERSTALLKKESAPGEIKLEATQEEVKQSRFSPRLIRSLRQHLKISQRELALLTGVTVGAAHLWEKGKFRPSDKKKALLVDLRKLGHQEVRKLLEEKNVEKPATRRSIVA
jgi:DNA-binding transcriptional regulator YiaG